MLNFLKRIFGDDNEREIKRMMKYVQLINGFEPQLAKMSDTSLAAKTAEFRQRLMICCRKRLP